MEADLRAELKRLRDVVLRVTAELGGKNQKLKHMEKKLKESSTKLKDMEEKFEEGSTKLKDMEKELEEGLMSRIRMGEVNDHLNHVNRGYKEEIRKLKMTVSENESLMKESENQKKKIELLVMEIKKRDAQLEFKCKQLQVLRELHSETQESIMLNTATQASRSLYTTQASRALNTTQASRMPNTVPEKCAGTKSMRSCGVQVQIDTNGLHKELKDKDTELDNELNRKQTLVEKEHRNNHDLQETRIVSVEEVETEDDEDSIVVLEEWTMEDFGDDERVECSASQDTLPPIPSPESLVDPCSDMPSNSSDLSSAPIVLEVAKEDDGKSMELIDECGKGDSKDSERVECSASQDTLPPIPSPESLADLFNDMLNDSSDLSSALIVLEVAKKDDGKSMELIDECGKRDSEDSERVECSASQDTLPPITPPESLVDPCSDMPSNSSDLSSALIVLEVAKEDYRKSMELIDECSKGDSEDSERVECSASQDTVPPIPSTESLADLFNDMPSDGSDLSSALIVLEVAKEDDGKSMELIDKCGKGDSEDSERVECSASQDTLPPIRSPESLADLFNDMPNDSSDLSSALIVLEVAKEDDGNSMELIDSGGLECNAFQDMLPLIRSPENLADLFNDMPNDSSDLSSLLPVPDDEIAELEWLPTLVENSLSAGEITLDRDFSDNNEKDDSSWSCTLRAFKNSSSCSGGKTKPLSPHIVVPGGVLSKRRRSAVIYQPSALNVVSPESGFENQPMPDSYMSSESEYFLDSNPPYTPNFDGKEPRKKKAKRGRPPSMPINGEELEKKNKKAKRGRPRSMPINGEELEKKKTKAKKGLPPSMPINGKELEKKTTKKGLPPSMPGYSAYHEISLPQQQQPIVENKKCLHCETTNTAQWRGGPMGPKTLCNACGVRYRSGRLFPEYRPANSPTFVASLHSSSHRKILQMRDKGTPDK